jgi:hypothetical protein
MFMTILGLALATAPPAAVTAQTEILAADTPDEFQMGNHQRNALGELVELAVPPETVDNWSRLITLQLYFGASARVGAEAFSARWRNALGASCSGTTSTSVAGTVDGFAATKVVAACPRNPQTGLPENVTAVFVQGQANLMIAQVAFRRPPTDADRRLVINVVDSLQVCDAQAVTACAARKKTGFVAAR